MYDQKLHRRMSNAPDCSGSMTEQKSHNLDQGVNHQTGKEIDKQEAIRRMAGCIADSPLKTMSRREVPEETGCRHLRGV